jgi:predicted enzyme related to lactoylglutathione lyase
MSERDGFEPGVPSWVDTWQDDAEATGEFYADLFGWQVESGPDYSMFKLRGRDVAGFGSPRPEGIDAQWTTYVWVDSADDSAARARDAGGSVLVEPFDALDGGRIAIIADPAGAALGVWAPGEHKGAQVVNEPSAWAMSALLTDETDAAKRFYGSVFGWETEEFDAGDFVATMWRLPGFFGGEPTQPVPRDVVAAMMQVGGEAGPARWMPDFWVADADAAVATAERRGGSVIQPVSEGAVGKSAVLADPAGAVFSISQIVIPERSDA